MPVTKKQQHSDDEWDWEFVIVILLLLSQSGVIPKEKKGILDIPFWISAPMWWKHNKFSVSLIIWMLLFFVTGTLGYSDLEVTIFKDLLSLKHAALQKKTFPKCGQEETSLNISYGTW